MHTAVPEYNLLRSVSSCRDACVCVLYVLTVVVYVSLSAAVTAAVLPLAHLDENAFHAREMRGAVSPSK